MTHPIDMSTQSLINSLINGFLCQKLTAGITVIHPVLTNIKTGFIKCRISRLRIDDCITENAGGRDIVKEGLAGLCQLQQIVRPVKIGDGNRLIAAVMVDIRGTMNNLTDIGL
ncbi:hypothetical protein SDC9_167144 [bioreactor metagenome]|uniref:Uncharacterized protein n=1 Tax=bioreactor metagenome TaxID=1076179 RepID=A0A645G1G5_9ZZZZ